MTSGYPPVGRNDQYAPLSQPTPPHLAHSRYSSADLYALPNTAQQQQNNPTPREDDPFDPREHDDESSDDSDDDDDRRGGRRGGGFGTYSDFQQVQGQGNPRRSKRYSQTGNQHPLQVAQAHGGGSSSNSTYGLKQHYTTTSSTQKLDTIPGGGGGLHDYEETVAVPRLSRNDWEQGEGLNEKNRHKFQKSKRKRQEMKGILGEYWIKAKRNWKWVVPVVVLFFVALILILYFCIPRTPSVTFRNAKVPRTVFTSTDPNPFITSSDPVGYSFQASIIFAIDATKSYVPVKYNTFDLKVRLRETGEVIGKEVWDKGEISVPGKEVTSYEFPMLFSGNYSSPSDPTFSIMKSSCAHQYPTTYRAPLNLTIEVTSSIAGVIGSPKREASIAAVECPVQWSSSAN